MSAQVMQIVEVWLGAFGVAKPYDAQPGDTWCKARILARKKNGEVWAAQLGGPNTNWIPAKYWREINAA